jgi:hypothetical protein
MKISLHSTKVFFLNVTYLNKNRKKLLFVLPKVDHKWKDTQKHTPTYVVFHENETMLIDSPYIYQNNVFFMKQKNVWTKYLWILPGCGELAWK